MNENRMAEVARLFGKKLGEEFAVKDRYRTRTEWCKFTEHGLLCLDKAFFLWQNSDNDLLQHLLKGTAVIVDE